MVFFMVFIARCYAIISNTMRGRLVLSWYLWRSAEQAIDDRFMSPRVWTREQPIGCYLEALFHRHRTAAHLL